MVTKPLEDALSSAGDLKSISSISRDGLALIRLEFPWGTDTLRSGLRCREIIDTAWSGLPHNAPKPRLLSEDPGDIPILTFAVFPVNGSLSSAKRLAEHQLRSRLQRIEGVGSVQLSGGRDEEILVETDPELLSKLGYTLSDIADLISSSNIDYPAGTLTEGKTEYIVKTRALLQNTAGIGRLYLPVPGPGM